MHDSVYIWVAEQVCIHGLADKDVLEIGSYDVNGTVRDLFKGHYWGIDVRPGPGVDAVIPEAMAETPNMAGDVNLCLEVLEHVQRPWRLLGSIGWAMRDDGWLLLSCRGYDERGCWPVHHDPVDLWRFSGDGLQVMLQDAGLTPLTILADPQGPGWLVSARKHSLDRSRAGGVGSVTPT